jgi:uncharacterized membrane protein YfcA
MGWILEIFLYSLIGVFSGTLAGLLGVSGGIITVPCLFFLFGFLGFPESAQIHMAIGTSLASMVFSAGASTYAHSRRKMVLWTVFFQMLPGVIIGSLIGAFFASFLSESILKKIFGGFACLLGINFLRSKVVQIIDKKLPPVGILALCGSGIGALSNILGIGGGIITVPFLLHHHISERKAIATSAATGFVITLFGACAYLYFGMHVNIPKSVGYLYLPAFGVITISSFISALYGARLTESLSPRLLRKIFGFLLIITGISMFLK